MDDLRDKKTSSGENFSFPVKIRPKSCRKIPEDDEQFEFGGLTSPGSPNSPADNLFLNGRLLPHVFPVQTHSINHGLPSLSRSTSRASSISRDSLTSSRSNSTNSRGSNCSSARSSTSESSYYYSLGSERRLSSSRLRAEKKKTPAYGGSNGRGGGLDSSRRWQLMAAAPPLWRGGSRRGPRPAAEALGRRVVDGKSRPADEKEAAAGGKASWFGRRVLKPFVSACKHCHAIKA